MSFSWIADRKFGSRSVVRSDLRPRADRERRDVALRRAPKRCLFGGWGVTAHAHLGRAGRGVKELPDEPLIVRAKDAPTSNDGETT